MVARNMINASDISLLVDEVYEILYSEGYSRISVIGKMHDISIFAANWVANYEASVAAMNYDCDDEYCEMWIMPNDECEIEVVDIAGFSDISAVMHDANQQTDAFFILDDVPAKIQFNVEKMNKPFYVLGVIDDFEIEEISPITKENIYMPLDKLQEYCCPLRALNMNKNGRYVVLEEGEPFAFWGGF